MPKDPAKNIARYKIEGGELNEFEFQRNQEAISEQSNENVENLIPGTPPEVIVPEVERKAHEIVEKRAKTAQKSKRAPKVTSKASKKKKPAAKKSAPKRTAASKKKKGTKKAAVSKKPASRQRSGAKKRPTKSTKKRASKK